MILRIKMKSTACGPLGNFHSGQQYDVEESVASRFVNGGFAEFIGAFACPPVAPAPESAAIAPPEAAVLNPARPRAAPRGRRS